MRYTIEEIREKAIPLARAHGVGSLNLFGSYARNEATEDSNLDFYIDAGEIQGLICAAGFFCLPRGKFCGMMKSRIQLHMSVYH